MTLSNVNSLRENSIELNSEITGHCLTLQPEQNVLLTKLTCRFYPALI